MVEAQFSLVHLHLDPRLSPLFIPVHASYSPSELCVGFCLYPGHNLLVLALGPLLCCPLLGNLSCFTLPFYTEGIPHHWGTEIPTVDITAHSTETTCVVLGVLKGNLWWEF